jgi:putative FmdB family regulatory protein
MPLYDYRCQHCGKTREIWGQMDHATPVCCDEGMERVYQMRVLKIKSGYPLWIDRMEDIQKAQNDRGERRRLPHPKEVGAT